MFVTGSAKRAIEDHFDSNPELERALEAAGNREMLQAVRRDRPLGCLRASTSARVSRSVLGHAVPCARPAVGDQPFAVHLADDLIRAEVPLPAPDVQGVCAS